MTLKNEISETFDFLNIWHEAKNNFIITKRTITKIPRIDKNIAYLSGVIVGDGTVLKTKRRKGGYHYLIRITSESKKYLFYLNRIFKSSFNYKGIILPEKRDKRAFYLLIQNAAIFWYFVLLGHETGKKKRPVVPYSFRRSKDLLKNFIAGVVDTDGYVKGNRIQLKQKSKNFLKDIYDILNSIKMNPNPPKVNYTDGKPFYYIRFDNKVPIRVPR